MPAEMAEKTGELQTWGFLYGKGMAGESEG